MLLVTGKYVDGDTEGSCRNLSTK